MLTTKIDLKVGIEEKHDVQLIYSKLFGKITVTVDGLVRETAFIVFGSGKKEFNLVVGVNERHSLGVVVYPGKAFWVKPVIEITVDGTERYEYVGSEKNSSESRLPNYRDQINKGFDQSKYLIRGIFMVAAVVFLIFGITIPIVTAILYPNELSDNKIGVCLGVGISIGFAVLCYVFSSGANTKFFRVARKLLYFLGLIIVLLGLIVKFIEIIQILVKGS